VVEREVESPMPARRRRRWRSVWRRQLPAGASWVEVWSQAWMVAGNGLPEDLRGSTLSPCSIIT